jgi:hypothetical protein
MVQTKEEKALKAKLYYEANKQKVALRTKKYREKNKEQIALKDKKYREKNKEQLALKNKIYTEKNKERIAEKAKKYREDNKEAISLKGKEQRQTEKGKQLQKIKGWKRMKIYSDDYNALYERFMNYDKCEKCGIEDDKPSILFNRKTDRRVIYIGCSKCWLVHWKLLYTCSPGADTEINENV